jgi:uncharacterized protein YlxW (UPF0749 family)
MSSSTGSTVGSTATGTGRGPTSTQQLVDLVLDPRDPGYEAAARRRAGRGTGTRPWYDRPAAALGALVIGFVLAVAWVHTHRGAPEAAKVHDSLVQRARTARDATTKLAQDEAALDAQLARLRDSALAGSSGVVRDLNRSRLLAGELAVTGPGLEVRLAEPSGAATATDVPGPGEPTRTGGGHILIDRDVRSVVNQLWADGAEAVSVNGIRLTPTSAIRFAGDAVLVDFQPISSPYVVDAIGDADALATGFAASEVASRYQTLASARGIGFSFHEKGKLTLPAAPGTAPQYAHAGPK